MGGKTTTSTTDNQYQFFQKPSWQGLQDFQAWRPEADPSIGQNFARQRQDFERSFVAPTGSYQTPELREQQMRSGIQEIGQNEAMARQQDAYRMNQQRGNQLGTIAGLSAPEFAQTKGTTTQKQGGGFWSNLLGGAAAIGSSFI